MARHGTYTMDNFDRTNAVDYLLQLLAVLGSVLSRPYIIRITLRILDWKADGAS